MSALLIHGVPIECINLAAVTYFIPAQVIITVLETEGGEPGMATPNTNGSFDYGPMQINSLWLPKLLKYGYTQTQIQDDPCINVVAGTWILSLKVLENAHNREDYWKGVASYHSTTPNLNTRYQGKLKEHYEWLIEALKTG